MKSQIKKIALTTLSLLLMAGVAEARERFELKLYGAEQSTSRIHLKQKLQQQYRVNANDYELIDAVVEAESPARIRGRETTVELLIAGRVVDWASLRGEEPPRRRGSHGDARDSDWGRHSDENFRRRRPPARGGYSEPTERITLTNRSHTDGTWQIEVVGPAKIQSVILMVEPKMRRRPPRDDHRPPRNDHRPPRHVRTKSVSLGEVRSEKVIELPSTFNFNGKYVKDITLKGVDATTRVTQALVEYSNGRAEVLYSLMQSVRQGQRVSAVIDADVRSITIRTVSTQIIGSRAKLEVSANIEN